MKGRAVFPGWNGLGSGSVFFAFYANSGALLFGCETPSSVVSVLGSTGDHATVVL